MERVAVVGLGSIADRHRRNLKKLFPAAKLYAMSASGRMPEEAVSNADHVVASIDELIEKRVQLVIVASPSSLHTYHSIPLIEASIPVLIEKPVTTNLDEVKELQLVANTHQTPVAVGYCLRYLPSAIEVSRLLASDKLGHVYNAYIEVGQYLPDWRPSKNYRDTVSARADLGGGALLELSHEFDYTQWLLGELTLDHAILRNTEELGLEVEDSADMLLSTSQKAIVHMHLDFLQRKAYRQCRFVGSNGTLEWDLIGNEVRFISSHGTYVEYSQPEWDKNQMYISMVSDFVEFIYKRPNRCVSLAEAAKCIQLVEDIKRRFPIIKVQGYLKG
ncbi:Gfo/Idh/MocA family oxidoreductase [Vibrio fluvialis]|nr:Gfo/Idh/MocA family oxidoreductase [Vibrio fluvialis]